MDRVSLICIKDGSKLRVRITSHGYKNDANCQFPRNLRVEGRKFTVPINNVKLTKVGLTYYYRVSSNDIQYVVINTEEYNKNIHIYGDDEDEICIICMDSKKDTVFGPCGHFNCCEECAGSILNTTKKCPICRSSLDCIIDYKKIN